MQMGMESAAHTDNRRTYGEYQQPSSSGPLVAVAFNNPIQTFPELGRNAQKDFKSRSDFSPLDF